jgi:hypothetical protein
MPTYQFTDGFTFKALGATSIVEALRDNGMFTREEGIEEYMLNFTQRAEQLYGVKMNADSPENFVADLMRNNLLIELPGS